MKELFFVHHSFQRVIGRCEITGTNKKVSFPSRAAEQTVGGYGVPRYQGKKLVRVLQSDRPYGR